MNKTTYEHYRNKQGANLFFEKKSFCNIFKLFTTKVRKSFLKLRDSINFHFENKPLENLNFLEKNEIIVGPASKKAKEKEFITSSRVPIKMMEREKERENEILDSNIENLFIKEQVILEDIKDETEMNEIKKIGTKNSSISKKKYIIDNALLSTNNVVEHDVNNYEKDILKKKESTNILQRSAEFSPKNQNSPVNVGNKSHIIEKKHEESSSITQFIDKDNKNNIPKNEKNSFIDLLGKKTDAKDDIENEKNELNFDSKKHLFEENNKKNYEINSKSISKSEDIIPHFSERNMQMSQKENDKMSKSIGLKNEM